MKCAFIAAAANLLFVRSAEGFVAPLRYSTAATPWSRISSSPTIILKASLGVSASAASSSSSAAVAPKQSNGIAFNSPARSSKRLPIPDPEPLLKYPAPPKRPFRFMPIRSVCRLLKFAFGFTFLFSMFIVNSVTTTLFIFLKFWMRKVKLIRYGGFMTAHTLPPFLELQFDLARWITYVPFLLGAADNLFQLRTKMRSADELVGPYVVPSDEQLISQVLLRSPMAFYTRNEDTKLVLDMSKLNDIDNFPDTYYDVVKVEVDKATSKITIYTKNDGVITKDKAKGSEWDRAKVHAMACMSYWIPGIGHSWVHFNLMDVVSATVYNELDRKSVLYSLLEPHTRYTNRINWEALGVQGPMVMGGTALIRLGAEATSTLPRGYSLPFPLSIYEPFTSFSMTSPEFVRNNAKRTTEYYFRTDEFQCPPKFLNSADAEIPYIKALKRYYPIVRDHVEKVLSYEDDETITKFLEAVDRNSEVDGYSLNITRFDKVDAIASILFDCVFIHSTDHHTTFEIFGSARYGIGTIRHPFKRWWFPGMNVPGDMLDEEDRVRWDGTTKVFFRWNDSKIFSNGLKSLRYKFRRHKRDLKDAARDFVKAIEREQRAMKKDGDPYTPIEAISRSICW